MPVDEATKDKDVATNASAAAADVRSSIDHQVKVAGDFDTKLSALIAALGTAPGLAASRVTLDNPERVVAFVGSGLLVALTVGLAFNGLRPRAASFGADSDAFAALVTDSPGTFGQEPFLDWWPRTGQTRTSSWPSSLLCCPSVP